MSHGEQVAMSTGMRGALWMLALWIVWLPASANAQVWLGAAKPRTGSVEIGAGGIWTGAQNLPDRGASLTVNPSGGLSSFDLFTSEPSIGAAIGAQASVAVYVTRALAIEGGVQFSRPPLKVRLTDDFEDAPSVTASSTMTEYVFTGSLVYHFGRSRRAVPFIAAGAGHLRDVHSSNELVETGLEYHGKAGIKMWFGTVRTIGLRADAGLSLRDGGFSYDESNRIVPTAAVSLLYLF